MFILLVIFCTYLYTSFTYYNYTLDCTLKYQSVLASELLDVIRSLTSVRMQSSLSAANITQLDRREQYAAQDGFDV